MHERNVSAGMSVVQEDLARNEYYKHYPWCWEKGGVGMRADRKVAELWQARQNYLFILRNMTVTIISLFSAGTSEATGCEECVGENGKGDRTVEVAQAMR